MSKCGCGCDHGQGVAAPCGVAKKNCAPNCPTVWLRTKTISSQQGTDEEGQPYEPKNGAEKNTIVVYEANGAVYIYDSQGFYTKLK